MKRTVYVVLLLMSFAFASHVVAAEFKIYPGATIDQKATKDATEVLKQSGMTGRATIYTTSDAFEKVVAFYKGMAKEWQMPRGEGEEAPKLRAGGVLRETYFIFDGAKDITTAKLWIKIQRPYFGKMKASMSPNPKYAEDMYEDIRNVTAVTVSEDK